MDIERSLNRFEERWLHHQEHIDRRRRILADLRRQRYKRQITFFSKWTPLDRTVYNSQREWNLYAIHEHRKAQQQLVSLYLTY